MPKRTDIKSILILGAGPIVIGQACEFDYSGAQACKALREEGYRVILVNSNPATIMTDPEMADATYIEPIHWEVVRKIIEKERPDAVLPTMGGQTALNCALELERQGVLAEFGVTMIGATADAIDKAEDRRRFDVAMKKIGLDTARSGIAHTMEEALAVAADVGFPCIIRPSFTMGGTGGGIAYNREEFEEICERGLDLSPTNELLIDESLIGWKEYEMEVVRDKNDNCIIVCSIENFDAMGIHTGDSITVAPAQTLTDKEYQIMRNASMAVLREIGVETGGSNVQFSVNPKDGRLIVIEMNPRVSRSSALASKATGFDPKVSLDDPEALTKIRRELKDAGAERIWYIADAFRAGLSVDGVFNLTNIDRWFLVQIEELVRLEEKVVEVGINGLDADFLRTLKRKGFADARLAKLAGVREAEIRKLRDQYDLHPVYKRVDTCAAEFATDTAYMYSTYEEECESNPSVDRDKIMVLGGGPNRIGQGIEFDYCCVHASLALREDGYETIMVNCNPETVSTDYDTSDRLYFEPVTLEDVLEIVRIEKPKGVIVQYGGQTPLKLARALEAAGVPVIGTSPDAIDRAEDRERFQHAVDRLKLKQPANATVTAIEQAVERAKEIGYPLVVRPSYVLGGRAMEIVYDEQDLRRYFQTAVSVSNDAPVLLDRFLDDAIEVDVDAICDGEMVLIGGIMEHIEQAGVHSGDSACSLPAYTLSQEIQDVMREQVQKLAFELQVRGLMNVQFAVKDNEVYLIEVNPRAARTVPFVSKATGVPLAKVAARVMAGKTLAQQGVTKEIIPPYYSVKEVVLPFNKFPGVDPLLGPEMRSTGEVMGVGRTFAEAFAKAQLGSNSTMKKQGRALLSVREGDKERVVDLAAKLLKFGFELDATHGTAIVLGEAGINPRLVNKVHEGRPHIQDRIKNGEYTYIINTTAGRQAIEDSKLIRRSALQYKVHYDTTLNGGFATAMALNADATEKVISVQEMHAQITK